jgi:uncharacterized protein
MAAHHRETKQLTIGRKLSFSGRLIMSKVEHITRVAAIGSAAVLFAASLSVAQEGGHYWTPTTNPGAVTGKPHIAAKPLGTAQRHSRSAFARMAQPADEKNKEHHLILQVNTNDAAAMNLALNNATNVTQYYKDVGEKIKVEVIAFGPGLHMLRDDTSPVKARIETMALSAPEVSFRACGITRENMHKAESKEIPIIPQAQVVKSGVVRVMELEEKGWTYVKP